MKKSYIVASSRAWHEPKFKLFAEGMQGSWSYVESRESLISAIEETAPRYVFFLHWNWLVPPEVFRRHECVCFHMTDVPYGRGGSPLQNLISAGKTETVVSALRMDEVLDAGPVYAKRPMSLHGRAEEIYLRAGDICWDMIREIVEAEPPPSPQIGEVTEFRRRKPEESVLPSRGTLAMLYDHIRMLDAPGYPMGFISHGEFLIEFSHAELAGDSIQARVVLRKATSDE